MTKEKKITNKDDKSTISKDDNKETIQIPKELQPLFNQRDVIYGDITLEFRHLSDNINKLVLIDNQILQQLLKKK